MMFRQPAASWVQIWLHGKQEAPSHAGYPEELGSEARSEKDWLSFPE